MTSGAEMDRMQGLYVVPLRRDQSRSSAKVRNAPRMSPISKDFGV
jgi:hypothetical protein